MTLLNTMTAENTQADRDVIVVDTNHPSNWYDLHELWRYRELIWILAVRDVTVRYRQTVVGLAWTALQPVALMLALGLFTKMVSGASSSDQIPGEVKTLSGLVLYQLFAAIITVSTNCLVDNRQMLTKVYFPRVVLPLAACLRPLLDFSIGLVLLTLTMTWFRVTPAPTVVLSPVFVLLTVFTALGFGLWLSALNAHYRDFSHLVPFAPAARLDHQSYSNRIRANPGRLALAVFREPDGGNAGRIPLDDSRDSISGLE